MISREDEERDGGATIPSSISLTRVGDTVRVGCVWDSAERTVVIFTMDEVMRELLGEAS